MCNKKLFAFKTETISYFKNFTFQINKIIYYKYSFTYNLHMTYTCKLKIIKAT